MSFKITVTESVDMSSDYAIQINGPAVEKWFVSGEEVTAQRFAEVTLGEIERLQAELREAREVLQAVLDACDQGRMIPRPGSGVGGMTIEANIRGSIYTGVPAWPIEEARAFLAKSQ